MIDTNIPHKAVVLDTETTGLDKSSDYIVEVAALEMIDGQLTGNKLQLYIRPPIPMNLEAQKVHGITDAFLADKPTFAESAEQIREFVEGATVVAHNAPFDVGFLAEEFKRANMPPFESVIGGVIDTLAIAREVLPNKPRRTLDALCDHYGVDRSDRALHGALIDCELLFKVYRKMIEKQQTLDFGDDGQPSESELKARRQKLIDARPRIVIKADAAELAAHRRYLDNLEAALNKGKETPKPMCVYDQEPADDEPVGAAAEESPSHAL